MPAADKAKLAEEIFSAVFDHHDTFRDDEIGADLAYLLGAIVCGDHVDWTEESYGHSGVLPCFISESFAPNHVVWNFILTDAETQCPECARSNGPHFRGECQHANA
jgi:hypothetical protein